MTHIIKHVESDTYLFALFHQIKARITRAQENSSST